MVSRILCLRYLGGTVFATVPLVTHKVHASEGEKIAERRIKISELPIYKTPEDDTKYEYVEEISSFQQNISDVRQTVWNYLDSMQESIDFVTDKWGIAKAHTTELVTFIQEDPGVLPRAGVITVAGLGGVVAGYRGGLMKKAVYSSLTMLAAASLCYPNQAIDITTKGCDQIVSQAKEMWEGPIVGKKATSTDENGTKKDEETEPLEDMGQSKKEDADLYTTRSK